MMMNLIFFQQQGMCFYKLLILVMYNIYIYIVFKKYVYIKSIYIKRLIKVRLYFHFSLYLIFIYICIQIFSSSNLAAIFGLQAKTLDSGSSTKQVSKKLNASRTLTQTISNKTEVIIAKAVHAFKL